MTLAKATIQFLVILVVIAVLVSLPLASIYRSTCGKRGDTRTEYTFVVPIVGDPPEDCRNHDNGFAIIGEEIGL